MELRQVTAVLQKWWWLVLLAAATAGLASFAATTQTPKIYQAKTTLIVGQVIQDPNPTQGDFFATQALAQTYVQLVRREPILNGAIQSLGLRMDWHVLANNTSVSQVPNTQLMEIAVNDTNQQRAQALADAIAEQLILKSPANASAEVAQYSQTTREQIDDLTAKMKDAREQLAALKPKLDAATSAREIDALQSQINVLEEKISGWQATYANLLATLQGGEVNSISIVEPAALPTTPISPNVPLQVGLATLIGALLAAGGAAAVEYLDDTIKTPVDVNQAAELHALGGIAAMTGVLSETDESSRLITAHQPRSPISEAFRVLRTGIQFSSIDHPNHVLLITSAKPAEGKTTTAANLAVVMAQAGHKVLMIDADLRRPTLHRVFGLNNWRGLTNVLLEMSLSGTAEEHAALFETAVQPASLDSLPLSIMTSGPLPPNPSELLSSVKMKTVLAALSTHFDFVVIDSPPVLAVTDAVVLSMVVDSALIVVNAGRTRRATLHQAVELLRKVKANVVGVALNRLIPHTDGYEYYYQHTYYHSEGTENKRRIGTNGKGKTRVRVKGALPIEQK